MSEVDNPTAFCGRAGLLAVSRCEVLAGPVYDSEEVLCADVDLGAIVRGQYDLDVSGHYARPDVFSLKVDETERGVEFGDGDGSTDPESA